MKQQKPIIVMSEVTEYEVDHRLPSLLGTPRQVAWGRIVRWHFFCEAGTQWFDQAMSIPSAKEIIAAYERLKHCTDSKRWIEEGRPNLGRAIKMILELPRTEEAARIRSEQIIAEKKRLSDEKKAKAAEGRRLIVAAKKYEQDHNLSPLLAASKAQESFGRRCRYQVLTALNMSGPIDSDFDTAESWIDIYNLMKTDPDGARHFIGQPRSTPKLGIEAVQAGWGS